MTKRPDAARLRRAIAALGLTRDQRWSVLDAGCGQRHFAQFGLGLPQPTSVGLDSRIRLLTLQRA